LLEHCGGNFPLWLTPEQVVVLPVSEKYEAYAQQVAQELENADIRALVDDRNEKVGRKIRDAEVRKIPFMVVVGETEQEAGSVAVRRHGQGDLGSMSVLDFSNIIKSEVEERLAAF
jgi:threonyl-tRNA synthetase